MKGLKLIRLKTVLTLSFVVTYFKYNELNSFVPYVSLYESCSLFV
jgi:hypothetical protein